MCVTLLVKSGEGRSLFEVKANVGNPGVSGSTLFFLIKDFDCLFCRPSFCLPWTTLVASSLVCQPLFLFLRPSVCPFCGSVDSCHSSVPDVPTMCPGFFQEDFPIPWTTILFTPLTVITSKWDCSLCT